MDINMAEVFGEISWDSFDMVSVTWPEWERGAEDSVHLAMTDLGASNYGAYTLTLTASMFREALEALTVASAEEFQVAWAQAMLTVPNFYQYMQYLGDSQTIQDFMIFALTHLGEEKHATTEGN